MLLGKVVQIGLYENPSKEQSKVHDLHKVNSD
jgi:hypothetical protein